MAAGGEDNGPPLCFLINREVRQSVDDPIRGLEIGLAIEELCGDGSCTAVQRWMGSWRLYTKNRTARNKIVLSGLTIRGAIVTPHLKNPLTIEQNSVKVIFGKVPFSVAGSAFASAIKAAGATALSEVKDEQYRDNQGKLSSIKTGRRFIYIASPSNPLPDIIDVAGFKATIFYKGRKNAVNNTPPPTLVQQNKDLVRHNSGESDNESEGEENAEENTLTASSLDTGSDKPVNQVSDTLFSNKLKQSTLVFVNNTPKPKVNEKSRGRSFSKRRRSTERDEKGKKPCGVRSVSVERSQATRTPSQSTRSVSADWFDIEQAAS